jgi:hypothetical protein
MIGAPCFREAGSLSRLMKIETTTMERGGNSTTGVFVVFSSSSTLMMSSLHHHSGDGGCHYGDIDGSSSSSGDSINLNYPTKDNENNDISMSTTTGQKTCKRCNKKKVSKSQHSLDSLRQRVSHLMRIFEEQGWFVPMPDSNGKSNQQQINNTKKSGAGKVWSNRNYGADKKRQRKQSERVMLETRILQLETVLNEEHGVKKP